MREADLNEAASLLDSVKDAEERTRWRTRPGFLEVIALVLGLQAATLVTAPWVHVADGTDLGLAVLLGVMGLSAVAAGVRSRRNLGLKIRPTMWAVPAAVFVTLVITNTTLDGDARKAAVGYVVSVAAVLVGILERSVLIATFGAVFTIVSVTFAFGIADWITVIAIAVCLAVFGYFGRAEFFTSDGR